MKQLSQNLVNFIDHTVHPAIKQQGGMLLLRARMLSFSSAVAIPTAMGLIVTLALTRGITLRLLPLAAIILQFMFILCLNRWIRRGPVVAAISMFSLSILLSFSICLQSRSLLSPGFLWFPMLMLPTFLLCGRRLGLAMSLFMMLMGGVAIFVCRSYGVAAPFQNDTVASLRTLILTLLFSNFLTMVVISIYFYLLDEGEKKSHEQRSWIQRTARMQELLQMSGHFAIQTNRPLDVLGTALHNMEDSLKNHLQPRKLLPLMEPVESSVRDLADVARSFSLFSRRYLQEGLEQTSINAIFQHVDTIYNVGVALRRARLDWNKLDQDISIYTQTAKLVMLIISLVRRVAAEGATQLSAEALKEPSGIVIVLRYRLPTPQSKVPLHLEATVASELVFDPELTEDLIRELCSELSVVHRHKQEGEYHCDLLQWVQT